MPSFMRPRTTSTTVPQRPTTPPPKARDAPSSPNSLGLGLPPGSPPAPHGLKGLGRRVSHSKPVQMLKGIASRTSLKGRARGQSTSSVKSGHSGHSGHSVKSGHSGHSGHSLGVEGLKEEREFVDTDYGREAEKKEEGEEKEKGRSPLPAAEPQLAPHVEVGPVVGKEETTVQKELETVVEQQQQQDTSPKAEDVQPPITALSDEPTVHEALPNEPSTEVKEIREETTEEERTPSAPVAPVVGPPLIVLTEAGNVIDEVVPTVAVAVDVEPAEQTSTEIVISEAEPSQNGPEAAITMPEKDLPQEEYHVSDSIVIVEPVHQDANSLSSSSTTVDIVESASVLPADSDKKYVVLLESQTLDMGQDVQQVSEEPVPPAPEQVADINPFVVNDPEDPVSEPEMEKIKNEPQSPPEQSENVVLTSPPVPSVAPVTPIPVPEKKVTLPQVPAPVHPAPTATITVPSRMSSPLSDDEAPELHVPALNVATLFLPVPHTDPISALLTKYVPEPHLRPPRDTTGEWQHTDFHTLVMTNNWRALARMARDRIVTSSPRDVELVLNLWYIRLSSLARLRLFNQAAAECENLFGVLAVVEPPPTRTYILNKLLPFELEVLRARCSYWAGDQAGYLDDVSALLRKCRIRARTTHDLAEQAMWKERGARMALIVASQLVEMKDYTAATALLEPLCTSGSSPPSPALRSALARIYLQGGLLESAKEHFAAVEADPEVEVSMKAVNAVTLAVAMGDWTTAAEKARVLAEAETSDVVAANNYAVSLLGQGKIKEGIHILEKTLEASPSAATTAESYLFNLSTMYELRAGLTAYRKKDLLVEVAKWSGDGLRPTCLKMSS